MTHGSRIARNALALVACQPVTWTMTLAFTVVVARRVGPADWGIWGLAWWLGLVIRALLELGLNAVLLKEIPRRPHETARYVGAAVALRLSLAPVLLVGISGFAWLARYGSRAWVVITIVSVSVAISYVEGPLTFGLQALERAPRTALIGVVNSLILTGGGILLVGLLKLDIVAVAAAGLVAAAASVSLQWWALSRTIEVRPRVDPRFTLGLVAKGMPYWITYLFFTVYVWADGILLSLIAPGKEVGWYNVSAQLISTLGFLPYAVVTAVFPALSRSFHEDLAGHSALSARSFQVVLALSAPVTAGLVVEAGPLVTALYGRDFAPAGLNLAVLALTLPPVYVATLANAFVVAADRQVRWAWLMGGVCVINPLLNVITIPYFHHSIGNGAVGTAAALLATDLLTGVAAIAILPAAVRRGMFAAFPVVGRSALAAGVMALVILPVRQQWLPIPVLLGVAVYAVAAVMLRVVTRQELRSAMHLARSWRGRRGSIPAALTVEPDTAA